MWIGAIMILLFALGLSRAEQKTDFSGKWVMDKERSKGLPPEMDQIMTVTQNADRISVETKVLIDADQRTISDSYTADGKEAEFKPQSNDGTTGKGKRVARWAADGKGLEVNEEATFNGPDGAVKVTIKRQWTLSDDGKTLVIVLEVKGPQGDQRTERTFSKSV
jgi:hypothetical protein